MARFLLAVVACVRNTTILNLLLLLWFWIIIAIILESVYAFVYEIEPTFSRALLFNFVCIIASVIGRIVYWYNKIK